MMKKYLAIAFMLCVGTTAQAAPFVLADSIRCSLGNQENGIAIDDVTGNNGGATDCWGTYNGNDSNDAADGFKIGDAVFTEVAKQDMPNTLSGDDIGLKVTPTEASQEGEWEFDQGALDGHDFLIVLKAANSPGFAVWLFSGDPDATSYEGTWHVAWGKDLSHLAIYKGPKGGDDPGPQIPVPGTLGLIGAGLLGLRTVRRRKR